MSLCLYQYLIITKRQEHKKSFQIGENNRWTLAESYRTAQGEFLAAITQFAPAHPVSTIAIPG
jgi:hypothetical protein